MMKIFWGILITAAIIAALFFAITFVCFLLAFYSPKRIRKNKEEYQIPKGKIYEPFREIMINWMKETREMPHEDVSIVSFDGLTLRGRYYECIPGAPIELMLHGYRGDSERDLCGGVQRCFKLNRNALVVDQRGCGRSDGRIITFGIKEYRDCLSWVDFMLEHFGDDVKILLTGISMGASTVLIAASQPLPKNVVGVLGDCGYTNAKDIIKKVIRQMKLPANLLYPIIKLGAKIYGGFDLEEVTAIDSMKKCTLPVILFHGENDDFVPCEMSRLNYDACTAQKKRLITTPGAGHGLCYLYDSEGYLRELSEFFAYAHQK